MPRALTAVRCTDIVPAALSWLWPSYLARGKLAVLDGDPGTGKSLVTIDVAARLTRGSTFPGSDATRPPASVLVLNAEDDAKDTIQPRVTAAGGDPERVHVLAAPGLGLEKLPQFPDDIAALETAIRETAAALVVIDPMMAFFPPTVSANNDQCIRTALSPLAALAAETGACILLVRHVRKSGGSGVYRGAGSIGIVGAVRTGLLVTTHPDDTELRLLAVTKCNLGAPGPSLGFRLRCGESGHSVVEWVGPIDLTSADMFGTGMPAHAARRCRDRATEWLSGQLADGPRTAAELQTLATEAGIAWRTLQRVKDKLGIVSDRVTEGGKATGWVWRDPHVKIRRCDWELPPLEDLERWRA
jgi:hypothetical protein